MKIGLIILTLAFICSSEQVSSIGNKSPGSINLVNIKNHEYIVVTNGTTQSGISIIHSESCKCHIDTTLLESLKLKIKLSNMTVSDQFDTILELMNNKINEKIKSKE